jgi:PAS domain S-box-containing protein
MLCGRAHGCVRGPGCWQPIRIAQRRAQVKGAVNALAFTLSRKPGTVHQHPKTVMTLQTPASSADPGIPEVYAGVFLTDPAGLISAWSPAAARITGYTAAEMIGAELPVLYTPEERAEGRPSSDLALATRSGRGEHQGWMLRKDGQKVWTATTMTALRDAGGVISGFACFTRDLAEENAADARRRARAEQLSALAVGREDLAGASLDIAALLRRIAHRARELTSAEAAIIEMRDGVGDRARAYDGQGQLDVELGAILFPQGGTSVDGRVRCIRYDLRHETEEILGDVCDRVGIGSLLAIPIVHERGTIAWVAVLSHQSSAFSDESAANLELMASLLGASLTQAQAADARQDVITERLRDQSDHRARESGFREALDASLDALIVLDAVRDEGGAVIDFAVRDANRRGEVVCGLPRDAFAGLRLAALPDAASRLPPVATMARVIATTRALEHVRAVIDASGVARQVQEQIVPFGDGVLVTMRGAAPDP